MPDFESNDQFYDFVRRFSDKLREANLEIEAKKLRHLLDEVAWTTCSELFGELGRLFLDLERDSAADLTPVLRSDLQRCLEAVRRVWPDLK
ncbi:MAG: hypothetical protein ACYTG0_38445 [Planctomycetota bacterium]|jgi:hypothetical protein